MHLLRVTCGMLLIGQALCSNCATRGRDFFQWADGLPNRSHLAPLPPPPDAATATPTKAPAAPYSHPGQENRPAPGQASPPDFRGNDGMWHSPVAAPAQAAANPCARATPTVTTRAHLAGPSPTSLPEPARHVTQAALAAGLPAVRPQMPGGAASTHCRAMCRCSCLLVPTAACADTSLCDTAAVVR